MEGEDVLGFTWNFPSSNGEARKNPTLQGMSPYPTNRESRNIIDSKGPASRGVVCDPSHASATPYKLQWATGVRTPMNGATTLLINWCFLSHLPSFHRMCVTDTTSPPKNHRRRLRFPVLRGCNKLKAKGRFESSRLKAVLSPSHFCEEILFVP